MEKQLIHLLYTKIAGQLPQSILDRYLSILTKEMRSRNSRYVQWQDQLRDLLGKLLLVNAFKKIGLQQYGLHQIRYNEYGRPYMGNATDIDFNISHSGSFVLCAITRGLKVGVDIEEIIPVNLCDFEDTMTCQQWAIIEASKEPLQCFYSFWTKKESVIKADSRGLSIPLQDIHIKENTVQHDGRKWYLKEINIDPGYCMSVAVDFDEVTISQVCLDYGKLL
jgi:4'-phosphopantetheinyl transferase